MTATNLRTPNYVRYLVALTVSLFIAACSTTQSPQLESIPVRTPTQPETTGEAFRPISFEKNLGQTDPTAQFLARSKDYTVFLTQSGATLSVKGDQPAVLSLSFAGSRENAIARGLKELHNTSNYIFDTHSIPAVPHYENVVYRNIYPGIDLVYYSSKQGHLEYDFVIQPEATYSDIALSFNGAESVSIARNGDLVLRVGDKEIIQKAPHSYQEINGARVEVASRYRIDKNNRVGFSLGQFDTDKPLIIDPVLGFSTYLGGAATEQIEGIAIDSSGNIYVAGYSSSTDYPTTTGVLGETSNGSNDIVVSKLNPTGTSLLYSTYIGGSSSDIAHGIAVDGSGNAYVVGETGSSDFPTAPSPGAFDNTYANGNDAFALKLSADGTTLVYSTYLGGAGTDRARNVAVDGSGLAYVVGTTVAEDYPTTSNAFQQIHPDVGNNAKDQAPKDGVPEGDSIWSAGFLSVLDAAGTSLTYSTFLGGPTGAFFGTGIEAVALGAANEVYVTGGTSEPGFPATSGAYDETFNDPDYPAPVIPLGTANADPDAFVAKFDVSQSGTSSLVYATFLGGGLNPSGSDNAYAIAVDGSGNAYITGSSFSDDFPTTTGAFQETSSQAGGFVAAFDATGSNLLFSTFLSGPNSGSAFDFGRGIALDSSGDLWISGHTGTFDFPIKNPLQPFLLSPRFNSSNPSGYKVFVTHMKGDGSDINFSTYLGGCGWEENYGLVLDASDNPIVIGKTPSSDFPTTAGAVQTTLGGGSSSAGDGFIFKLDAEDDTAADLEITLNNPVGTYYVGDTVSFQMTIDNHGPNTSSEVEVRTYADNDNFDFVSASASQGSCANDCLTGQPSSDHGITCYLGDMANGDTVTVTVELRALKTFGLIQSMVYSDYTSDPNAGGISPYNKYDSRSGNNYAQANVRPLPPCGNGSLDTGEECDDGTLNGTSGSNCSSQCTLLVIDSDNDGIPDDQDGCPNDTDKAAPGQCGCGNSDTDSDNDGTADCVDLCPNDVAKVDAGSCGCGVPDTDSDGDQTPDCLEECVNDAAKEVAGACGCGVPDTDTDKDGTPDCLDSCPSDPIVSSGSCEAVCEETDISSVLLTLDGTAKQLRQLGRRARRKVVKATGERTAGKKLVKNNAQHYTAAWTATWSIDSVVRTNCSNAHLCASVSSSSSLDTYTSALNALFENNKKLLRQLRKARGKDKTWKSLNQLNSELLNSGLAGTTEVPQSTSSCT